MRQRSKGVALRFVVRIRRFWLACVVLAASAGCTRTHYRIDADRETYRTLDAKLTSAPWRLWPGFNVLPDPRSRFYDPTPIEDPLLPVPAPQLGQHTEEVLMASGFNAAEIVRIQRGRLVSPSP